MYIHGVIYIYIFTFIDDIDDIDDDDDDDE